LQGRVPFIIAFVSGRSIVLGRCSGAIPPQIFLSLGRFLAILAHVTWPRAAQPVDGSILIKFSLKTGPESVF